jgi:hypothetical protein
VVTGDLNATAHSDEVRLLGGHQTAPPVAGQVLVDAWLYADPHDHGHTWDRANPFVRATGEPGGRIDYVLLGTPRRDRALQVRSVRRFGTRPVDGQWPSDHAGVVADVTISRTDANPPGLVVA